MSEYTQCNYCKLQSIRRDARKNKQRIVIKPVVSGSWSSMGGYDVYRLSNKGEKLDRKKNWICWFMAIGEECGC